MPWWSTDSHTALWRRNLVVSTVKTGAQSPALLAPVDKPTTALHCNTKSQFLAVRTNGRAYATMLRLSVVVCTECIVAKRCVL